MESDPVLVDRRFVPVDLFDAFKAVVPPAGSLSNFQNWLIVPTLRVGKFTASASFGAGFASCGDGAMKCSIGMTSGEIRLDRYWGYGSTVTLAVEWGFIIFKFN